MRVQFNQGTVLYVWTTTDRLPQFLPEPSADEKLSVVVTNISKTSFPVQAQFRATPIRNNRLNSFTQS
jgi:hypothetical protein